MPGETLQTEQQFASWVDQLATDPRNREQLIELLHEGHPLYDGRGSTTIVRMRGWILLSLARTGLTDDALIFVLEELDTGVDAYLMAAAARTLRSYPSPQRSFAPFVMRALTHIRYRDEALALDRYGEYAVGTNTTSAVRELLKTLAWLGPNARDVLPELQTLKTQSGGISKKLHGDFDKALRAIEAPESGAVDCCTLPPGLADKFSWALSSRRGCEPVELTLFADQHERTFTFKEFFSGRPSIVVFFYTRCDNPLKCSLTITKLARVQKLLSERELSDRIQTAAITYDPGFDLPERMRRYGEKRGLDLDDNHRMLRALDGMEAIRKHFKLGVSFIESLVNRHRLEVYVLDRCGRVASSFERLHWDEEEVVQRAIEVLGEVNQETGPAAHRKLASPLFATLATAALAVFPKCPLCWAAYMSLFGIAGLESIPYSPWLQPLLAAVVAVNLGSVWLRARTTGRVMPFIMVCAGALMLLFSRTSGIQNVAVWGVLLTLAGSLLSTLLSTKSSQQA